MTTSEILRKAATQIREEHDPAFPAHDRFWAVVADWLTDAAVREDEMVATEKRTGLDYGDPLPGDEAYAALTIARAYLEPQP